MALMTRRWHQHHSRYRHGRMWEPLKICVCVSMNGKDNVVDVVVWQTIYLPAKTFTSTSRFQLLTKNVLVSSQSERLRVPASCLLSSIYTNTNILSILISIYHGSLFKVNPLRKVEGHFLLLLAWKLHVECCRRQFLLCFCHNLCPYDFLTVSMSISLATFVLYITCHFSLWPRNSSSSAFDLKKIHWTKWFRNSNIY